MPTIVATILIIVISLIVMVLPVQWAARAMGARRTGFGRCLLALLGASILHSLGLMLPVAGTLGAFFLAALGFAAILNVSYMRGIGVALLHFIFSVIILMALAAVFGVSVAALATR